MNQDATTAGKVSPKHTCHAINCTMHCKPEWLMCYNHWKMVPPELQKEVWKHYRPGQCNDKRPSKEWLFAAKAAIKAVHEKEKNGQS